MSTPQPFHTRSLQVTAMQYTGPDDLPAITAWMAKHGETIDSVAFAPTLDHADGENTFVSILTFDRTDGENTFVTLRHQYTLWHNGWLVHDGATFHHMTDTQFTTYHHTTANS